MISKNLLKVVATFYSTFTFTMLFIANNTVALGDDTCVAVIYVNQENAALTSYLPVCSKDVAMSEKIAENHCLKFNDRSKGRKCVVRKPEPAAPVQAAEAAPVVFEEQGANY